MCRSHAAVRHLLGGMLEDESVCTIVDMEAGLEHLSRGTDRHVDTLLVVVEPYYRALETARRVAELARELGIGEVQGIANKLRDEADETAVRDFARRIELPLVAEVPFDDALRRAELTASSPLDVDSKAVAAIRDLAPRLGF